MPDRVPARYERGWAELNRRRGCLDVVVIAGAWVAAIGFLTLAGRLFA